MDVSFRNTEAALPVNAVKAVVSSQEKVKADLPKNTDTVSQAGAEKEPLSREDVKHITEEMNKFLQMINADLQFAMHDKTKQLMVQVVDTKERKVLREFPPHELLDTIAKIRDYVGFLLDKKV